MANIIFRRSELNKRIQSRPIKDYPLDPKEQEKPLYLVMQSIWFNKIESGEKTEEYRDGTDHYKSKIFNRDKKTKEINSFKNFKTVLLQEGYHPNARRMIVEVKKIELMRDFTIHLGAILERINF